MNNIVLKDGTELPLLNLKGKAYLPVVWRLVWFRKEHPDWSIETEFVYQNDQSALARATIKSADGHILATAHKEESLKDFPVGYREKAETGAIGRCLGLIGYATQFEPDFDEGSRIVDSPIAPVKGNITPDQPGPGDGVQREGHRVPGLPKELTDLLRPSNPSGRLLQDVHFDQLTLMAGYYEDKYKDREAMPAVTKAFYDKVCARLEELMGEIKE